MVQRRGGERMRARGKVRKGKGIIEGKMGRVRDRRGRERGVKKG